MAEDNTGQDKNGEAKLQSELPTDNKAAEDFNLPEDVSDRTRQEFEKLKKHNQELAKKLEEKERQSIPSVLDSLSPKQDAPANAPLDTNLFANILNPDGYKHLNKEQIDKVKNDLVDDEGYIKADLLKKRLDDAEKRASDAEKRAADAEKRFENYEQTRETKLANKKYPQLDPKNENFDPGFYRAVKNELIGQMIEGKKDLLTAAADAAKYYPLKEVKNTQKEEEKKVEEKQEKKAQINVSVGSNRNKAFDGIPDDDLAVATRKGVKGAVGERLKRAGF
jgi:hypothetical protein